MTDSRARRLLLPFLIVAIIFLPGIALAAQHAPKTPGLDEAILLSEILLLVLLGRALGELIVRIGQPAIVGQLLAGIVLGPSVFGALWPEAQQLVFPHDPAQKAMLSAIGQFGILLLLLLTGMDTDLKLIRGARQSRYRSPASRFPSPTDLPWVNSCRTPLCRPGTDW